MTQNVTAVVVDMPAAVDAFVESQVQLLKEAVGHDPKAHVHQIRLLVQALVTHGTKLCVEAGGSPSFVGSMVLRVAEEMAQYREDDSPLVVLA